MLGYPPCPCLLKSKPALRVCEFASCVLRLVREWRNCEERPGMTFLAGIDIRVMPYRSIPLFRPVHITSLALHPPLKKAPSLTRGTCRATIHVLANLQLEKGHESLFSLFREVVLLPSLHHRSSTVSSMHATLPLNGTSSSNGHHQSAPTAGHDDLYQQQARHHLATRLIHEGSEASAETGAVIPGISLSTTYKQQGVAKHKVRHWAVQRGMSFRAQPLLER